jgi:tRNA modification GTPase
VIDTAGIRETDDPVEQEGVRRARARAADADLVLWLTDSSGVESVGQGDTTAPVWLVRNKIDLDRAGRPLAESSAGRAFRISASRGDGVPELITAMVRFAQLYFGSSEGGLIGRTRQRKLLQETAASLQRCVAVVGKGEELAAEELRTAAYSLGRLLGRVDVEDILDVIFREFCVGE